MNQIIKRGFLFLVIMFIAAGLSPFVQGQDYSVSPNPAPTQTYIPQNSLNSGFSLMKAISAWNGFDALLILGIILIPAAVYLLWKFTSQQFATPRRNFSAKGYQISYHDIYISRKDKRKKQRKLRNFN